MKNALTFILFTVAIFSCNSTKKVPAKNFDSVSEAISYINIQADTTSYICDSDFNDKLYLKLDTVKSSEDSSYSIGQLGKCNPANYDGFKIGKWTEYYKSGNIKSEGNYAFGLTRNCCSGGYCYGQYSYKEGRWIYYYENKKVKADIIFDITLLPIESIGCGDTVYFKNSAINSHSKFFDEKNNLIIADSLLLDNYLRDTQGNNVK